MKNKSFENLSIKAAADDATGKFVAYGNVFGVKDNAGDITVKGCFSNCIQSYEDAGKMPRLLGQHGHKTMPLGIISSMVEDEKGLRFEGQFCLETQAGAEAYALCKMGAIDQFSIGYVTLKETMTTKGNMLEELDVKEISLVTFACNEESELVSIKSLVDSGEEVTERVLQKAIREGFGLSKRQAESIINGIKSSEPEEEEELDFADTFRAKMKTAEKPKPWEGFVETKNIGSRSFHEIKTLIEDQLIQEIGHWDFYICDIFAKYGHVDFCDYRAKEYKCAKFNWKYDQNSDSVTVSSFVEGNLVYGQSFEPTVVPGSDQKENNVDDLETKSVDELAELLLGEGVVATELETKSDDIDLESLDLSELIM